MRFAGKQVFVNTIIKWPDICFKVVNCCYENNFGTVLRLIHLWTSKFYIWRRKDFNKEGKLNVEISWIERTVQKFLQRPSQLLHGPAYIYTANPSRRSGRLERTKRKTCIQFNSDPIPLARLHFPPPTCSLVKAEKKWRYMWRQLTGR